MTEDPRKIAKALAEIERRKRENALDFYAPYPKQAEFHDLGATKRERLFRAGNRIGKTFSGAAEMAFHLTGRYPGDWMGKRFDRPVEAWASGKTGLATRDIVQSALLGKYGKQEARGTGSIPKDCVDYERDVTLARGVADAYDTVHVKHVSGLKSSVAFKSFDQGREKWQGTAQDVIWCDEEPPMDIYGEALARIAPTNPDEDGGIIYTTFTPLLGKTELVTRFKEASADRGSVVMTLYDALHINAVARQKMIDGYPEHERESRINGVPFFGSGLIFTASESSFVVDPFPVPAHWALIWGIDPGVGHPFGAALIAWNKDADCIYVVHGIRMKDTLPLQQADAMKRWMNGAGARVPVAWPQDAHQRKEFDGQLMPLRSIYKKHGLAMCAHHATFVDGSNSTELGILEMQERLATGRLKVFRHLSDWLEEFREYHREDGQIVKKDDDLLSATRVAVMAKRDARPVLYQQMMEQREASIAKDVDIALFE